MWMITLKVDKLHWQANAADVFWQHLVSSIQELEAGTAAEQDVSQLFRVFQEPHLSEVLPRVPQYLATGNVSCEVLN